MNLSKNHLGFSWTVEGGVVEVVRVGESIIRAPLANPIQSDGNRWGREWWPAEPAIAFEAMWRPLTWATEDAARSDFVIHGG